MKYDYHKTLFINKLLNDSSGGGTRYCGLCIDSWHRFGREGLSLTPTATNVVVGATDRPPVRCDGCPVVACVHRWASRRDRCETWQKGISSLEEAAENSPGSKRASNGWFCQGTFTWERGRLARRKKTIT